MNRKKFISCLGALLFLFIAATGAGAQQRSSSWVRGAWEGVGYQTDDQTTWAITLTARGRSYSIDYPSLNCGGRWKLVSINGSRARFREVLNRGQDKCADHGHIVLQRLNRKQILFLYSYDDAKDISASAVLNRKRQS